MGELNENPPRGLWKARFGEADYEIKWPQVSAGPAGWYYFTKILEELAEWAVSRQETVTVIFVPGAKQSNG